MKKGQKTLSPTGCTGDMSWSGLAMDDALADQFACFGSSEPAPDAICSVPTPLRGSAKAGRR